MRLYRITAPFLLAVIVACGGDAEPGESPAIQQASGEEPEIAPPEEGMEMAAGAYVLKIVNPMPHDMVVSISTADGAIELGTVPAQSSADFALTAPPGMTVSLQASDPAQTHTEYGSVDLSASEAATWTIGAGAG